MLVTNLILYLLLAFLPPPSFYSPHSNNCPPLSRKTLVPLENSITRLHKRFKIMVLSLCAERECTWLQLKQEQMLRYCVIAAAQVITAVVSAEGQRVKQRPASN